MFYTPALSDVRITAFSLVFLSLTAVRQVGCAVKPAILSVPVDVIVASDSFTVLCIKSDNSTVTWYRNGRHVNVERHPDFQVTGDGSLHVKNAIRLRDEGVYRCSVSNAGGAVRSGGAQVRFAYLDKFNVGDWIIDKQYGSRAVISCMAPNSFPQRTIQWTKKTSAGEMQLSYSSHYAVSQGGDLHFASLTKADSGQYICTVTNHYLMTHVARTVTLQVMPAGSQFRGSPPRVADTFEIPKTALKGDKFVLECIVYGMPVPTITLRKEGYNTLLGKTTGNIKRLVIDSFKEYNAGKYGCTASGPSGQTKTKSTVITMETRPEWITAPRDIAVGLGTTVTLPCVAYGIPTVQYMWFFNGRPLIRTQRHNFTEGNLTIQYLVHQDSGMYQCFAENKHGQLNSNMELTASEIPAGFGPGSRPPKSTQTALTYTNVVLTCNPTGTPKPSVRWMFSSRYLTSIGKYMILRNGDLAISNITKAESGLYTCHVSNRLGRASRSGFLNVVDYIITDMPSNTIATLGQDVKFTCGVTTVKGIEITFRWLKFFVPVKPNKDISIWRTEVKNLSSHTSDQKGYMKLSTVQYSDAGPYTCRAEGNKKTITANALLTVQGPPDPPTGIRIHQDKSRGEVVNVTWILGKDNYSKITKVIIQYTTQFTPQTWKIIAEENDPDKGWSQIALSPWVQYTFRALAVNDIGNSTPSAPSRRIHAPPAVPSKYPVNIQGKGSTPFTVNISWQPLAKIDHNGPGLYYIVYHQRADSQGKPQRNEVHNGSSFLVSAADYYMKYTIKVQAANNIGFGPKSPAIFAYSGEMVPIGAPRDLDVTISSADLAYATWTGIPGTREATRGRLLGYKVYYWKAPSGQTRNNAEFKATIATSATLHLQPFRSYRFQVVAYNSAGDGPASNVVGPLTTLETLPGIPSSLALSIQNRTHVELHWSPPEEPNGIITVYVVTIQKLSALTKPITVQTPDNSPWVEIRNLNPKATYKISVLAVNRAGSGPPEVGIFDLPAAPQSAPTNVTATFDEFLLEAVLTWESVQSDIEGFRIFYWSLEEEVKTIDVDKTKRKEILTGLDKDQQYSFQLAAFKPVHGGHYILGPRSQRVTTGEVPVTARKTKSSACLRDIPRVVAFSIFLTWLQVR